MTFKTIKRLLFTLIIVLSSCKENKTNESSDDILIFNASNKEHSSYYDRLELDKNHSNLLNPRISDNEFESVMTSWTGLHKEIGSYLSNNGFKWESNDSIINIVHKFYFKPDGKIKTYFFNIINDDISIAKQNEYANLISDFAKNNNINFTKNIPFAQCGKTKYLNK